MSRLLVQILISVAVPLASMGCGSDPGGIEPHAPASWSKAFGDTSGAIADGAQDGSFFVSSTFVGTVDVEGTSVTAEPAQSNLLVAAFSEVGGSRWARALPGTLVPQVISADEAGGVWVAGTFTGTVDFGDGPVSRSRPAMFLAHWNAAGERVFAKTFVPASQSWYEWSAGPAALATLSDGGVVLAGVLEGRGALDLGGGALQGKEGFHSNAFLVRFDASGAHLFSRQFDGAKSASSEVRHSPQGLSVDGADNILLWGSYSHSTLGLGGDALPAADQHGDSFIAGLNADGTHRFSRAFAELPQGLVADRAEDGTSVFCGQPAEAVTLMGVVLENDFCARIDASGELTAAYPLHKGGHLDLADVKLEANGSFWLAGALGSEVDFGNLVLREVEGETLDPRDAVLLRYDSDGTLVQARQAGDTKDESVVEIVPTGDGATVVGWFEGTIDFGQGELQSVSGYDLFLAHYPR